VWRVVVKYNENGMTCQFGPTTIYGIKELDILITLFTLIVEYNRHDFILTGINSEHRSERRWKTGCR